MPADSRSRRDRPAKPPLSRDWIVAATIEIMRAEGLPKATMRRVAQALDTGPASLYVYVASTAELHAAVLDELIGPLPVRAGGDWRDRLEGLLRDYAGILFTHPGLARSALVLRAAGPNAIRLYDRILALLLEGGVPAARAAWGLDLLLAYVTANAAEHSAPDAGDAVDDAAVDETAARDDLARALGAADPAVAPHVREHAGALMSGTPAERVTWALRALMAGIAVTPTPLDRPVRTDDRLT
ncbi:MAG TPA: TetR/AcrR family transcriptional regulator C-terminal domain-containing protein [Trebonia sp.]|jgi:AcrR family transcriptional regulator|nr:TetR/AcrR family transcriptional regulator C-terminal domain-containing protein [Trebonia sp.]